MDIHLDHAGVGRHLDDIEARVDRRLITLDMQWQAGLLGRLLHRGEQFEIMFELFHRRHEHAERPVARLDGQRGAHAAFVGILLPRTPAATPAGAAR